MAKVEVSHTLWHPCPSLPPQKNKEFAPVDLHVKDGISHDLALPEHLDATWILSSWVEWFQATQI